MVGELDYILEDFVINDEEPTLVTKENVEYFCLQTLLLVTKRLESISVDLSNDCLKFSNNRRAIILDIDNVRYLLKEIEEKVKYLELQTNKQDMGVK